MYLLHTHKAEWCRNFNNSFFLNFPRSNQVIKFGCVCAFFYHYFSPFRSCTRMHHIFKSVFFSRFYALLNGTHICPAQKWFYCILNYYLFSVSSQNNIQFDHYRPQTTSIFSDLLLIMCVRKKIAAEKLTWCWNIKEKSWERVETNKQTNIQKQNTAIKCELIADCCFCWCCCCIH